ncbi:potassium channel family protein [Microbacterium sp. cx-55]|uniref:potassium channel family protein n=1 Tax=unclassified Microbacterium TaxID=2609290 RepID=UPI001CBB4AB4|nr:MULTISPECIES: potassium channel family protein [unclassified Microbacterium]MBZ4488434.1 potassium channel family protein [Microbacterium sp. cx-55]MCC4909503.1 potassium channel family protein [Microbacterium sp. cx-59]UGB35082.1 potassium channel family protein [Microbacterium sp. cx-55]
MSEQHAPDRPHRGHGDESEESHRRGGDPRGETAATRRWEKATFWPLTAAALAFIVAQTVHVLAQVTDGLAAVTGTIVGVTWALFIADYLARLAMSRPRGRWFRAHLFDLAVAALPVLRPVRLLGALTRIPAFTRTAAGSLRSRLLVYGFGAALLLIWTASVTVLGFERAAPGGTIRSFGDAVWWAFCTVTTVGYGDFVPVTVPGRIIAVGLMFGGVVLVGLIVATFSSWVMERATRTHIEQRPATRGDIQRLEAELRGDRPDPPVD